MNLQRRWYVLKVTILCIGAGLAGPTHAGDPNARFDGSFNSSYGWTIFNGYASISNGVLSFEGRNAVNAYAYANLAPDVVDGDFTLRWKTRITSANINPNVVLGGLSDTIGKYSAWANGLFAVAQCHDLHGQRFMLGYRLNGTGDHGDVVYVQSFEWTFDTWYYLVLRRQETGATLDIYADGGETNLLGSVHLVQAPAAAFRYLYAFSGAWAGYSHEVIYGDVDSFALAPIECSIRSDLNADKRVDLSDFALFQLEFGKRAGDCCSVIAGEECPVDYEVKYDQRELGLTLEDVSVEMQAQAVPGEQVTMTVHWDRYDDCDPNAIIYSSFVADWNPGTSLQMQGGYFTGCETTVDSATFMVPNANGTYRVRWFVCYAFDGIRNFCGDDKPSSQNHPGVCPYVEKMLKVCD